LLRARPVAGDRSVGADFCSAIQDLIYRDEDRETLVGDIRAMRRRMEEEVGKESEKQYNIKQGAGGLVDIEFVVQYSQLFHGKKHRWIRVPGTYNALRALRRLRLLKDEDCVTLLSAYLFLRQLESKMRIVSNQATSELNRDPAELWSLARRMGYLDDGLSAGQKLLLEYEGVSRRVRGLFLRILGDGS